MEMNETWSHITNTFGRTKSVVERKHQYKYPIHMRRITRTTIRLDIDEPDSTEVDSYYNYHVVNTNTVPGLSILPNVRQLCCKKPISVLFSNKSVFFCWFGPTQRRSLVFKAPNKKSARESGKRKKKTKCFN